MSPESLHQLQSRRAASSLVGKLDVQAIIKQSAKDHGGRDAALQVCSMCRLNAQGAEFLLRDELLWPGAARSLQQHVCVSPPPPHRTSCQPLLPRAVSQRVCAPTMSLKKGARMAMMVVNTTYMDRQTRM